MQAQTVPRSLAGCARQARQCQTPQPSAACPLLHSRQCAVFSGSKALYRLERRQLGITCSVSGAVQRRPFEEDNTNRLKARAPDLPVPGPFQQTLKQSFTVGGLGLHTAEYAFVRVRPAFAEEGRYFVRVPKGTNAHLFKMEEPREVDSDSPDPLGEAPDPEEDDLKVQLFLEYLKMQDEGYEGSFDDFVGKDLRRQLDDAIEALEPESDNEQAQARSESELYVLAHVDNVRESHPLYTTLGSGETRVQGVEHLLSALEMMGVDNARIEIEGGGEVPIVDGSAVGWAIEVQAAGVSRAMLQSAEGEKESGRKRRLPLVDRPLLVTGDNGAFISYVPGNRLQLSAGVDHADESSIIGRQFFTWAFNGTEKDHYRWQFASARNYSPSTDALQQLRADGYVKGGTQMCTIIGHGDRWYDTQLVRFFDDEPARHKLVDLTGDMSLLASPGNGGVPNGHTVAFQANHELSLKFVRAMAAAISEQES